ncbi:PREDICTED: carbonic anhydrase 14-like [Branchiostoma belcheri]|uniref:Carbonic anhydrase 14-like n=1 Tax=Branchiostoma belcheri TaxID=7741 RepID=A0A6P5A6R4_BRABE|nr:PREDICTED: carbonic anhydrase 14-like [Branchiostoma belcheri]
MGASTWSWLAGVLLLQAAQYTEGAGGAGWTYSGDTGPDHWANANNSCGGDSQSPINIQYSAATNMNYPAFTFQGYSSVPTGATMTLYNTGHAINVNLGGSGFSVSGGGLTGTYNTAQFHFHWGTAADLDARGGTYPNLGDAVASGSPTALAVLGFFLELDDTDNAGLNPIVSDIANVANAGNGSVFSSVFTFDSFLPANRSKFYRYSGSLTTPGCNEIVVWTVFEDTIKISRNQLSALLGATYYQAEGGNQPAAMANNWRPVQALNTRQVYRSFQKSGTWRMSPAWQVMALGVLIAASFCPQCAP